MDKSGFSAAESNHTIEQIIRGQWLYLEQPERNNRVLGGGDRVMKRRSC